eukprot:Clim_evm127s149 gene=Clim_evmTU127s149
MPAFFFNVNIPETVNLTVRHYSLLHRRTVAPAHGGGLPMPNSLGVVETETGTLPKYNTARMMKDAKDLTSKTLARGKALAEAPMKTADVMNKILRGSDLESNDGNGEIVIDIDECPDEDRLQAEVDDEESPLTNVEFQTWPVATHLHMMLEANGIVNAVWHKIDSHEDESEKYDQLQMGVSLETEDAGKLEAKPQMWNVQFIHKDGDTLLRLLGEQGIGNAFGKLWVQPVHIFKDAAERKAKARKEKKEMMESESEGSKKAQSRMSERMKTFRESVKSKLIIEELAENISGSAELTFDYVALCSCAALIAGLGLIFDSVVTVIAAMLVSPIMGPIMSFVFGRLTKRYEMVSQGLLSEGVGISVCYLTGIFLGFLHVFGREVVTGTEYTLPNEVLNRGNWEAVVQGALIAIPSGAAVAVSLLQNNQASLVGVAISASLLPPLVNSGILLTIGACYTSVFQEEFSRGEYFEMAGWSALIAFANILVIIIIADLTLRLKSVGALPGDSDFYKTTLKFADRSIRVNSKADSHDWQGEEVNMDELRALAEGFSGNTPGDDVGVSRRTRWMK